LVASLETTFTAPLLTALGFSGIFIADFVVGLEVTFPPISWALGITALTPALLTTSYFF